MCGRSCRPYRRTGISSMARSVCGASLSWTTLASRYMRQATCHFPPMWLPFRSFVIPLSSRSCRHFWRWSASTGDSCPASPAHCGRSQVSCSETGRIGVPGVAGSDGQHFRSSQASTAVRYRHSSGPPYTVGAILSLVNESRANPECTDRT
jgi:hypothetical protein